MKFSETLRIVLINILQNKIKVILTSLGIIVGAATIVMVIAIGRGGEEEIRAQFSGLNAETIYINIDYMRLGTNGTWEDVPRLTIDNMNQIMDESTSLKGIYLRENSQEKVSVNGKQEYAPVVGVTEQYSEVSNLNVAHGADITELDVEDYNYVAVIGDTIAKKLFNSAEGAINNMVKIGTVNYKIIGVLERTGEGLQGITPDDSIFLPYSTFSENVLKGRVGMPPQVVALAESLPLIDRAKAEIKSTIDYVLEDGTYYVIEDTGSRIEAATKSATTMKMLLIAVATIVFIVGGIGIMNVLFVSVKERTREIGILKALGSSRFEIMVQFLLESIIISVFGGVIGVAISYCIMPLMKFTDIAVAPSIGGKIIALFFAILTGTIFGIYPAYKAAQLKPIEALNYE